MSRVLAGLLAGGLTFVVVPAGGAWADHDHGRGTGHQAERTGPNAGHPVAAPGADTPAAAGGTPVTEDTDANDGGTPNNVVDAGDDLHPSGRDRSVEAGGSGNQGRSPSDPDAGENGGADKPGGPGGDDLADQDGNNGCGNDDDFEDDNNGRCRPRPPVPVAGPAPQPGGAPQVAAAGVGAVPVAPEVLGLSVERQAPPAAPAPATPAPTPAPAPQVLGVQYERAALAATGAGLDVLAMAALGLVGLGAAARRAGRRR